MICNKKLRNKHSVLIGLLLLTTPFYVQCASTPETQAQEDAAEKKKAVARSEDDDYTPEKAETRGKLAIVTTTLNNEAGIEGSFNSSTLSDSLMSIDDLARKEPDNIALLTTYLSFLRLHGNSQQTYDTYSRKGGAKGAKSVWFLLETGYGAMKKKDYGFADYLFGKAEKLAAGNVTEKAAVQHAYGVLALLQGKTQTGIASMRKAAEAQPPYLPSLLTLGFLGLRSGDVVGAERIFRAASSSFPNSLNARIGLAAALRGRGKIDDALTAIQSVYKSHGQDRRVAWNYALVLADNPAKRTEALEVLNKYFQLPGSLPDVDSRANALITKLQQPPASAPATASQAARSAAPVDGVQTAPKSASGTQAGKGDGEAK